MASVVDVARTLEFALKMVFLAFPNRRESPNFRELRWNVLKCCGNWRYTAYKLKKMQNTTSWPWNGKAWILEKEVGCKQMIVRKKGDLLLIILNGIYFYTNNNKKKNNIWAYNFLYFLLTRISIWNINGLILNRIH